MIWITTDTPLKGTVIDRDSDVVVTPRALVPTIVSFHRPGLSCTENVKVPSAAVAAVSGLGPGVGDGVGDTLGPGLVETLGFGEAGDGEGSTGGAEAPAASGGPR